MTQLQRENEREVKRKETKGKETLRRENHTREKPKPGPSKATKE